MKALCGRLVRAACKSADVDVLGRRGREAEVVCLNCLPTLASKITSVTIIKGYHDTRTSVASLSIFPNCGNRSPLALRFFPSTSLLTVFTLAQHPGPLFHLRTRRLLKRLRHLLAQIDRHK